MFSCLQEFIYSRKPISVTEQLDSAPAVKYIIKKRWDVIRELAERHSVQLSDNVDSSSASAEGDTPVFLTFNGRQGNVNGFQTKFQEMMARMKDTYTGKTVRLCFCVQRSVYIERVHLYWIMLELVTANPVQSPRSPLVCWHRLRAICFVPLSFVHDFINTSPSNVLIINMWAVL